MNGPPPLLLSPLISFIEFSLIHYTLPSLPPYLPLSLPPPPLSLFLSNTLFQITQFMMELISEKIKKKKIQSFIVFMYHKKQKWNILMMKTTASSTDCPYMPSFSWFI